MEILELLEQHQREEDATNWYILLQKINGYEFEDAVSRLQPLLEQLELCKGQEEAWARYYAGCRDYWNQGNVRAALEGLLRCREIATTDVLMFEACELLGDIYDGLKDFSAAADYYRQAAKCAASAFPKGDTRFISAQFRLCHSLCRLSNVEEAEEEHSWLKCLADELVADGFARAVEKGIQGLIQMERMQYKEAKAAHEAAADILRGLDVPSLDKHLKDEDRDCSVSPRFIAISVMVQLHAFQAMAKHEMFFGNHQLAGEVYREALSLTQKHNDEHGELQVRSALANIERDFLNSEAHLNRMREISGGRHSIDELVMRAKLICTEVATMLEDEGTALDLLDRKDPSSRVMVALARARNILADAERLVDSDCSLAKYKATVHYWQGFVETKAFQPSRAVHFFEKAITLFNAGEKHLGGSLNSAGRIAHHETGKNMYRYLQLCLLCEEPEQVKRAVVWAERERARDMVFQLGDVHLEEFDSSEEAAWAQIQAVCNSAGNDTVFLVFTELSDCVTITYFLHAGDEPKFCFPHSQERNLMLASDLHLFRDVPIFKPVDDLLCLIQAQEEQLESLNQRGLEHYHRVLIQPWEDDLERIRPSKLVIIPTQELSVLPFAALFSKEAYLIQRFAVSYAPSLRVFQHCQAQQELLRSKQSGGKKALVVGNPALSHSDYDELLEAKEEAKAVAKALQGAGYEAEVLLDEDASVNRVLSSIPSSDWVHFATHGVVDETFPNGALLLASSSTSSSSSSTVANVEKYLSISRSAGFKQMVRAMRNTSQQEVENPREEVYGQELAGAGLKAVAVVLSACQTGLGQISGEGLLGLSRCLHIAGAASTVVSLWEVDDWASKELFRKVYQGLSRGEELIFALQAAMQGMIKEVGVDGGRTYCIRHWAPFILSGSVGSKL